MIGLDSVYRDYSDKILSYAAYLDIYHTMDNQENSKVNNKQNSKNQQKSRKMTIRDRIHNNGENKNNDEIKSSSRGENKDNENKKSSQESNNNKKKSSVSWVEKRNKKQKQEVETVNTQKQQQNDPLHDSQRECDISPHSTKEICINNDTGEEEIVDKQEKHNQEKYQQNKEERKENEEYDDIEDNIDENEIEEDTIVLLMDAYDVLVFPKIQNILEEILLASPTPLVFCGENGIYPEFTSKEYNRVIVPNIWWSYMIVFYLLL